MRSVLLVWAHECFTPRCDKIGVVMRAVETNDSGVAVPMMYCPDSLNQMRLIKIDDKSLSMPLIGPPDPGSVSTRKGDFR